MGAMHQFEGLSRDVIGAALAVHCGLGPGFLESIYHAAMRVSLAHRGIPFESELPVDISFESSFMTFTSCSSGPTSERRICTSVCCLISMPPSSQLGA